MDYLLDNPDVLIHYGYNKKHDYISPNHPALRYMQLVGLNVSSRLVHGEVFASHVLLPREGGCQDPVYNSWEILHMREYMLEKFGSELPGIEYGANKRKKIVLFHRTQNSRYSLNLFDSKRRWSNALLGDIVTAITSRFLMHDIDIFSDGNATLMSCLPCQIQLLQHCDIAIGMHGAGLVHTIYMRPQSLVVEIVPYNGFDSRYAPVVGIFSRLSALMALNHFTVMRPESDVAFPDVLVNEIESFILNLLEYAYFD